MLTSISTTSGRVSRATERASSPSPASPTTAMSSRSRAAGEAPLGGAAGRRRAGRGSRLHPDGDGATHREPAERIGPYVELAAESQRTLAHAGDAVSVAGVGLGLAPLE